MVDGREQVAHELKKHGLGLGSTASMRAQKRVAEELNYKDVDDMMAAVGAGKEKPIHVVHQLLAILAPDTEEESTVENLVMTGNVSVPMLTNVKSRNRKKQHTDRTHGVIVEGLIDAPVRLSKCCSPVPGDDILGFVTRGRGVSVHRSDCPNAENLKAQDGRIISVAWEKDGSTESSYQVGVYIQALDRMNLLRDIINILSDTGVKVLNSNTVSHADGMVEMRYLFQVSQVSNIERILGALRGIEGVFDVHRMLPGSTGRR